MCENRAPAQPFGSSSGADPADANTLFSHLRPIYRRAESLHEEAAEIRRAVDEMDGPARAALLNWAELTEHAARALRRAALRELDAVTAALAKERAKPETDQ